MAIKITEWLQRKGSAVCYSLPLLQELFTRCDCDNDTKSHTAYGLLEINRRDSRTTFMISKGNLLSTEHLFFCVATEKKFFCVLYFSAGQH